MLEDKNDDYGDESGNYKGYTNKIPEADCGSDSDDDKEFLKDMRDLNDDEDMGIAGPGNYDISDVQKWINDEDVDMEDVHGDPNDEDEDAKEFRNLLETSFQARN